jgi:hypothetical protein
MQNTVFKTGATLLVLLIGVYATVACLRLLRPREEIGILLVTPAKLGMYFREVGRACGNGHVAGYRSSDGVYLSESVTPYPSPGAANTALRKCLERALTIVERAPKFNKQEQIVGERIVAFFPAKEEDKQEASVIWTEGDALCSINSSSMSHLLAFEQSSFR